MVFPPRLLAAGALLSAAALVAAKGRSAERALPPAGKFLAVDGARLHYVDDGDGPPLVLLHGLGSMVEDFLLSGFFARARRRYRVLAFDRPGYGHSERPRGRRWDPAAQADLLRRALEALGVERPIVLGHSWGTSVAIALALRHPGVPRSLVLACGLYFPTLRLDAPLLVPPAIPLVGALLRHTVSPLAGRAMWPLWLRTLFHPSPVPPAFHALAWKALRPGQLRAVGQETLHIAPATAIASRRYGELALPVAVVAGARDRYVSARAHSGRLFRALPNAKLFTSPAAGHMVHHSDPALVLEAVDSVARATEA